MTNYRLTRMTSAILQYRVDSGSNASFAIVNAGGIRATIDEGSITRGEVLTSFPFGNAVVEAQFIGNELWSILEGIVSGVNTVNKKPVTSFLQVSKSIKVEYNPQQKIGERLVRVSVDGEGIDLDKIYTVVTIDFLAGGGDNFFEPIDNLVVLDTLDEVLVEYIKKKSPVDFELDGRIAVVDGSGSGSDNGDGGDNETDGGEGNGSRDDDDSAASTVTVISGTMLLVWAALVAVVAM